MGGARAEARSNLRLTVIKNVEVRGIGLRLRVGLRVRLTAVGYG